ncbi:aspartyl protease AED3 [Silene latifolia]|uniref:aspartyl protease AED3 n=1 Tax=Silene latifolia TaxID=37657 RepID=UPI003D76DF00
MHAHFIKILISKNKLTITNHPSPIIMDLLTTFFFYALLVTTTKGAHNNPSPCSESKPDTSGLSIIHIESQCSPFSTQKPDPWATTVLKMASKDSERVSFLDSLIKEQKTTSAPIASGQQVLNIGNYLVRATVGTPGQLMFMVLDTSLDAGWVPCSGCLGCSSTMFSPNTSSTYGPMDCDSAQCSATTVRGLMCTSSGPEACQFNQSYGGDSSFVATLSHDNLSLGKDNIPNYAFGCVNAVSGSNIPPQGLLGLGRGSLSLMAQSTSLYNGLFSYCLPSYKSYYFSGSLKLGPIGQPRNIRTTPLLHNPHRPSLYYINLTGITVGRVQVPIPQEFLSFDPNTGAGTIIDSGTVITRFVQPVYNSIRDEYRNQTQGPFSSLGAFDTCFSVTHEKVAPTITLHFQDLDLKLPLENTLIHSSSGNLACLAMASAPSNVNSVLNIIASLQQQNLRIMFDTVNSRLGIARELCN